MIRFGKHIEALHWKNMRFLYKLLIIYIPLIILPAIVCMVLILNSYNEFSKNLLKKYSSDVLNFGVSKIEDQIKSYEQLSKRFITDAQIQGLLAASPGTQYDELEYMSELNERVNSFLTENSDYHYIKSIIINKQNNIYALGTERNIDFGVTDDLYKKRVRNLKGEVIWSLPEKYTGTMSGDSGNPDFTVLKLSRSILDKNLTEIAQLTIVIDIRSLKNIFDRLELKDYTTLQLTAKNGISIFEYSKSLLKSGEYKGKVEKYSATSSYNGWVLTAVYHEKLLFQPLYDISNRSLIFISVFILLGLIGTYIINIDIISPIRKLTLNIKNTLNRHSGQKFIEFRGAREIVEINSTYISMVHEMDRLIQELMETEKRKQKVEMRILQSQLSPHFLYNALNSVRWMAIIQKQGNIKSYVDALSNLLTYSLRNTDSMVALRYEIDILNDYVKIQKVRYHNFSFEINIEEQLYDVKILKLLLQPLIENALIHGLFNNNISGLIKLTVQNGTDKQKIHIVVEDNGIGMDKEKLEEVKNQIYKEDQDSHIGLKSVHDRLRFNFGDGYGLCLESENGIGTKVHLVIPNIPGERDGINEKSYYSG